MQASNFIPGARKIPFDLEAKSSCGASRMGTEKSNTIGLGKSRRVSKCLFV